MAKKALRRCTKCGETKSLSEFYIRRKKPNVIWRHECKKCYIKRVKTRYDNFSPEKRAAYVEHSSMLARRARERDPIGMNLRQSKVTAKIKGHEPCNATREEVLESYNGLCAVCGISENELTRRLHIDHDHISGKFRGWLCTNCNCALGLMKDSCELLTKLALYAEQNNARI